MTLVLHIPQARSLKEKRQVLKSMMDIIHRKFNVSIAEIEDQDLHQRATLGVACVANEQAHVHRVLEAVRATVESNPEAVLCDVAVEML